MIALVALGVAVSGPGRLSLDQVLGLSLAGELAGLVALGLGVLGALPPQLARAAAQRVQTS